MVTCEQDLNDKEERNNLTQRTEKNEGQSGWCLENGEEEVQSTSQRATETTSGKACRLQ